MSVISKFFESKEESVVGIDIGSSAIKLIQVKKKNSQAVLETYGELALGPYGDKAIGQSVVLSPEKIAQALSDLMKEKEVNVTTQRCGVAIPFASSLMSVVELPQVSAKQLSVMVPIEARKYIPVPISEVVLDWSIIPKSGTKIEVEGASQPSAQSEEASATPIPKIDVLVVAIHKDTIARYETIVKQAGLEASFFEIEIFSTMRSVLDDSTTPVMIMDIGAASTKLYIVERGLIQSSNTINRGSQDITAAMSKSLGVPLERAEVMKRQFGIAGPDKILTDLIHLTLDYIFEEANRALLAFEKKHNKAVSKVMLVGGGAALKGLAEFAKNNFKIEAVAGDPFAKVASPAFLEKLLKETAPEFAVSIGVALRKLAEEE